MGWALLYSAQFSERHNLWYQAINSLYPQIEDLFQHVYIVFNVVFVPVYAFPFIQNGSAQFPPFAKKLHFQTTWISPPATAFITVCDIAFKILNHVIFVRQALDFFNHIFIEKH